jgi:hypothetical protein
MMLRQAISGALPLLACGQFTPGYFGQSEWLKASPSIHFAKNIPAGGIRRAVNATGRSGAHT